MSDRPRFVLDANMLVSAALFKDSVPGQVLRQVLASGEILASNETIAEIVAVLSRAKFDRYLTREERDLFLTKLIQRVTLIEVDVAIQASRDPKDDMYLALAIAGKAASIVSGDADLRTLESCEGIPILSPSEFMSRPMA